MPLCLKSLELHGYKTFAGRTVFEFPGPITAIVGPNGSGKSNIADALRWVLGEQSFSLLRAKKTEDMIFSGSEQRPRAGMASAAVIFDNSDNWLSVDFSEVALARRAYRDGRNEYLLNNQHVRLREITQLLSHSGLSERTYTVIGQGLVDASLALKADERRRLFEEAAGIALYRARREESLRRLDTTLRNLDRVMDILAELEPRLRSLEKQAKRAQEFAQVQADLRVLLLEWYGFHWHQAQNDLAVMQASADQQAVLLNEARNEYQIVRQQFTSFRDHLAGIRTQLSGFHRQLSQLHSARETASRDLAVMDERRRALFDNRQSVLSDLGRLAEEVRMAEERVNEAHQENDRVGSECNEAQVQVETARKALQARQAEQVEVDQALTETRRTLNELIAGRAELQARIEGAEHRSEVQQQKLVESSQAIEGAEKGLFKEREHLQNATVARQQAEEEVQQVEETVYATQKQISGLEKKIKQEQAKYLVKDAEKARFEVQLDVLIQADQAYTGFADGARFLLEATHQAKIKGSHGALSTVLDVPDGLEVAITAALGEYLDAILIESGGGVEQVLRLLESEQPGRASLLPLEWLSASRPLKKPQEEDCLGVAAELVQAPPEIQPALDLLLGQVLVVRDRTAARRVLDGLPGSARAVTLSGEVFYASGPVLAGKQVSSATLSRPRQRREAQETLKDVARQVDELNAVIQQLTKEMDSVQSMLTTHEEQKRQARNNLEMAFNNEQEARLKLEAAQRQKDWQIAYREELQVEMKQVEEERRRNVDAVSKTEDEIAKIQEEIHNHHLALAAITLEEFQSQLTYWETRYAVSARALSDSETRLSERQQMLDRLNEQYSNVQERLDEIDRSLAQLEVDKKTLLEQESKLHAEIETLHLQIDPREKELENAEQRETELQEHELSAQQALARVERVNTQAQLDLTRKHESLEALRRKIEDDFGLVAFEYTTSVPGPVPLPLDGMVEQLPVVTELSLDLEEDLNRQRSLLRRMGAINPEAEQEYQSVRERFEFLNSQMDDLRKAEADLRQVIKELDELTRRDFFVTFEKVAEEFRVTFHRLFGGGSAKLVLTDPENLTDTGIDIEARLPGRREHGLALLSGGERSLTAIALIFALLKVSPTPVCVLDEVDAMLDEANVARFREMLKELSQLTQFVIITHNRSTVQVADVIYGVTMGRDSTSQVISLKLDEIGEEYYGN